VDRAVAESLFARLHDAQNAMYAGGEGEPLRALLDEAVEWHVPGTNPIAGTYRGVEEVFGYFVRRRQLASNSLRLHPGEILVGDSEHVAVLTDGSAVLDGVEHRWSTLGLYRIHDSRIVACWLLPLDPQQAWSPEHGQA
jgi:ketosteroid isomerase-like protein